MLYEIIKAHIQRQFNGYDVYLGTNPDETWLCILAQGASHRCYIATMHGDSEALEFDEFGKTGSVFHVELTEDEWERVIAGEE